MSITRNPSGKDPTPQTHQSTRPRQSRWSRRARWTVLLLSLNERSIAARNTDHLAVCRRLGAPFGRSCKAARLARASSSTSGAALQQQPTHRPRALWAARSVREGRRRRARPNVSGSTCATRLCTARSRSRPCGSARQGASSGTKHTATCFAPWIEVCTTSRSSSGCQACGTTHSL